MKQKIWLSNFISQVFETPNKNLTEWFGYYNYDTLNESHNKILVNRAEIEGVSIRKCDHIEVGYYDIPKLKWNKIGETDSFNWQQGAMLQWLPSSDDTEVVYNFHENNEYKSCITNVNNGKKRIIDFPIYGIHPSGKFALSLNYKRLYWCRAYHYQPVQDLTYDGNVLNGDGIYKIDIEKNKTKLLVKIEDIINVDPDEDFDKAKHWLEHIMISPDGSKFVFLHRFSYGNVMSYGTRLFICDFNGENLKLVKGWRDFGWSHFGWCSNDRFAIYTYVAPKIGRGKTKPGVKPSSTIKNQVYSCVKTIIRALVPRKLLNKTIGKESFYQFYHVGDSNNIALIEEIKGGNFDIDGHPSFTIDGSYMITDTYPDRKGIQKLIIYNIHSKKDLILGEFEAPLKGNPASCDLHPKLSRDNNYVAVDTAHTGRHQLLLFKINWRKIKEAIG